jgi:hypothetical protein
MAKTKTVVSPDEQNHVLADLGFWRSRTVAGPTLGLRALLIRTLVRGVR